MAKRKDLVARIENAPPEILVRVTQRHIDLFKCQPFDLQENPVAFALTEEGWRLVLVGIHDAHIGHEEAGVPYSTDTETMSRMHKWYTEQVMEPFVAEFHKKPLEDKPALSGAQQIYRDDEIASAFY